MRVATVSSNCIKSAEEMQPGESGIVLDSRDIRDIFDFDEDTVNTLQAFADGAMLRQAFENFILSEPGREAESANNRELEALMDKNPKLGTWEEETMFLLVRAALKQKQHDMMFSGLWPDDDESTEPSSPSAAAAASSRQQEGVDQCKATPDEVLDACKVAIRMAGTFEPDAYIALQQCINNCGGSVYAEVSADSLRRAAQRMLKEHAAVAEILLNIE